MNLQKRLAAQILNCSPKRIHFDIAKASEIKGAITKADVLDLINKKIITQKQKQGISQSRTSQTRKQKRKGRQKGYGSRKGKHNARLSDKNAWKNRIRLQRALLKTLRDKQIISTKDYRTLYSRTKGGFFRSIRHLKMHVREQSSASPKTTVQQK